MMCDKELLVGYLYDELPPAERSRFETHLFTCTECREEVTGLRATRAHLGSWTPPVPDLGFQIIRGAQGARGGIRRLAARPAWAFAAAAALILALGAAIANLDVRYGSDGLVVRTGWSQPADATAPAPAGADSVAARPPSSSDAELLRAELRRFEDRLRGLEAAAASRSASAEPRAAAGPRLSDAELLKRVREIIAQSEARQQRELALQIAQVTRDWDLQRRADLVRIQQGLGRLEAYTGADLAQQREMLNRFVRVSQGR